jgi:hypothetical protein
MEFSTFTYIDWMLLKGGLVVLVSCIYGGIQGWYS